MSVFGALGIAGSGLVTHRKWLDAVSDNIANMNDATSTDKPAFQARMVEAQAVDYGTGDGGVHVSGVKFGSAAGAAQVGGTGGTDAAQGAGGGDFASVLASSLDQLQSTQSNADSLATQAATGDLTDVSDYMIASNEASLATETVVALKNQAVSAFNEIMRMQI